MSFSRSQVGFTESVQAAEPLLLVLKDESNLSIAPVKGTDFDADQRENPELES